jgi:hypothetical protein
MAAAGQLGDEGAQGLGQRRLEQLGQLGGIVGNGHDQGAGRGQDVVGVFAGGDGHLRAGCGGLCVDAGRGRWAGDAGTFQGRQGGQAGARACPGRGRGPTTMVKTTLTPGPVWCRQRRPLGRLVTTALTSAVEPSAAGRQMRIS